MTRLGVVVHPTRVVDDALGVLRSWADHRQADIVQVTAAPCAQARVAADAPASTCDLIVAVGGDGTTLAALHAAAAAGRPVLGVAYGSLGVLTSTPPRRIADAVDRVVSGDWVPRRLPALSISTVGGTERSAFNDVVVVRAGAGQIRLHIRVDGELFVRLAGDGAIVSTALGSSAYSLSAGGPLLAETSDAFVVTPLPAHGGFRPPLVVPAQSEVRLDAEAPHGPMRLEIDGQLGRVELGQSASLTVALRRDAAVLVGFSDQEPLLRGLRRRRVIMDSARILADDRASRQVELD